MKRIGYLFLFLIIAAVGKAQLIVNVSDTVACADTDIMMTASGMETYAWSSTMALDTNAGTSVNATPIAGTYGVTIIGFSTTLNDTDTVIVSILIHPNPTAVVQSTASDDNDFVCFGSSATLTAISDTALLESVGWSPSIYLNTASGISVVAMPDSQTTYTALVTNAFGCAASGSKVVKVGYDNPVFSLGISPSVICPSDTATFIAIPTGIVSRFDWSPSAALSSSSGQIIQAWPASTTTYTMTAVRFGCEVDSSFTLDVFTPPTMSIMQSSVAPIKLDEAVAITVICLDCIEYFWKLPSSSLTTTQNVQSISPNTPGVKTIKVIGSDSNMCKSSVSTTITVEDGFIGTPFSSIELEKDELKITQQRGQILVESGSAIRSISLYSILGENVASYHGEGKIIREIPTNELASGIYIMNISAEGAEISKKLNVQ